MFNTIEEAIQDIKEGKLIVVIDDPDRENEGDLLMAGEKVSTETINFMVTYGRGLVCMPTTQEYLTHLGIEAMVIHNTDNHETAFTVSIDHINTTTGISAIERALTIQKFCDPLCIAQDFRRPGHIFPLKAREGGVLKRVGHTEAAVDLAVLAGLKPVGVICEIMNDKGGMARTPELLEFAKKHQLKIITIADLVAYRRKQETLIEKVVSTQLPTKYGEFTIHGYINKLNGEHHIALVKGDISTEEPVLTRIHSECLTGDALGSHRCDCGDQYEQAMKNIAEKGRGVLLYMRQEGRGIGLINKLKAYTLQDQGFDTVEANLHLGFPADLRDYGVGAQILKDLGIKKIDLMTNNPKKISGLAGYDIQINKRIPIQVPHNQHNKFYLQTKKDKLKHQLKF
ncbi:MAG: bifunctional 3,4-dihydroxy-2-butanone-4-phosphate synthase/GTP cyclohydrolase II [Brevinema sp.]